MNLFASDARIFCYDQKYVGMVKSVDTGDLKSPDFRVLRVRVPLSTLTENMKATNTVLSIIGYLSIMTIPSQTLAEAPPVMFEVYESQGASLIVTYHHGSVLEISLNDPACEEVGQCGVVPFDQSGLPLWNDSEGFLITTMDSLQGNRWEQEQQLSFVVKTLQGNHFLTFSGSPVEITYQQDLPTTLDYCCAEHVRCVDFYEEQCE